MNRKIRKDVETSCDYTLPDYMGDIKKLLSSRARAVPSGRYPSADGVEAGGVVEYELIYADAENRLTAINTSSDFAISLPTDVSRYVGCAGDAQVSGLSVRVTGPRKVSLKAQLKGVFTVTEDGVPEVSGDVFGADLSPEVDTRVINSTRYIYAEDIEREYTEEAERLEGLAGEDVEVIAASGEIRIIETRPVEGGVEIRGELVILAIVRTPEQPPFRIVKTIPFTETVSIDGSPDMGEVVASGRVRSVGVDMSEDGNDKVILTSASVELGAYAIENEALEVATDAYLTSVHTAATYEELDFSTFLARERGELRLEQRVPQDSLGTSEIHSIIWEGAEVRDLSCDRSEKGALLCGNLHFGAIACEINTDGSVGYIPIKSSLAFEENVNINSQNAENVELLCALGGVRCECEVDADTLVLRACVPYEIVVNEVGRIRRIAACSTTAEERAGRGSVITVYYPTEGDTLFSVAKKYGTTVSKLSLDNPSSVETLSGGTLSGIERLIIK